MSEFQTLIETFAKPGTVEMILIRPARLVAPIAAGHVDISETGISGDHGRPGKRAVTLIQAEHLSVIGAMLGQPAIDPTVLRRNLVVGGLNLAALKGRHVQIGEAILQITTICAPCSRMEAALGRGGYSAMRGHGGWCASVIGHGRVNRGDAVTPLSVSPNPQNNK